VAVVGLYLDVRGHAAQHGLADGQVPRAGLVERHEPPGALAVEQAVVAGGVDSAPHGLQGRLQGGPGEAHGPLRSFPFSAAAVSRSVAIQLGDSNQRLLRCSFPEITGGEGEGRRHRRGLERSSLEKLLTADFAVDRGGRGGHGFYGGRELKEKATLPASACLE
jgi:hypothetical protein